MPRGRKPGSRNQRYKGRYLPLNEIQGMIIKYIKGEITVDELNVEVNDGIRQWKNADLGSALLGMLCRGEATVTFNDDIIRQHMNTTNEKSKIHRTQTIFKSNFNSQKEITS